MSVLPGEIGAEETAEVAGRGVERNSGAGCVGRSCKVLEPRISDRRPDSDFARVVQSFAAKVERDYCAD